jgi:sugar fermentation stimulation protein A
MPDYHTDLAFSRTLIEVRRKLDVIPVGVSWNSDLSFSERVTRLEIPWRHLQREARDRGSYLLLLRLPKQRRLEVGRLGTLAFRRGWYVYVGSAMRNLSARIARHARRRKRLHWHVDYLRQAADEVIPLPIRSSKRQECEIARTLAGHFASGPLGFGSSDCDCPTHLFRHAENPLEQASFHTILQGFRMLKPC